MTNCKRLIIAIDGYSSCGKSTFAKAIAQRLGYTFIDSGAMYRAVTYEALRQGAIGAEGVDEPRVTAIANALDLTFESDSNGVSRVMLNGVMAGDEIRSMEVSGAVSAVSAIEGVRSRLVAQQQAIGSDGGVVMDGRDIGSVVFPDAQIKIFMTADPHVRGQRRYLEMQAKGVEVQLEEVVESVIKRDRADETRAISPLCRAEDAIVLDNSAMSIEQQMEWFDSVVLKSMNQLVVMC